MAEKRAKNLVIVESPAKAKTINKYLGKNFIVKASMGHVRDLPAKGMGVDLKTFTPQYEILKDRSKVVGELKKLAREAHDIYLATDLDREGEAIAWHLKEALGLPDERVKRVIFNAITRSEIEKAFARPHSIDMDRVNAQQARRILDRIVGYEISPLLWKKVARGLSAGRVQSVAVRLIVEREREIEAFVPSEYWKISAIFTTAGAAQAAGLAEQWQHFLTVTDNGERTRAERDKWLAEHNAFAAELIELAGKKFEADNKADARRVAELLGFVVEKEQVAEDPEAKGPARNLVALSGRLGSCPTFTVRSVETKRVTVQPPAPFITSTLQQVAASRLGFPAQRTMRLAQALYEAGYITYMRTDSTNISPEALEMVRSYIGRTFGQRYVPHSPNRFESSNKSAQEAHEAIHPTDVEFTPPQAQAKLGADEYKLYQLIWTRFAACQMPPAEFDQTTLKIVAPTEQGEAVFRASGRKLVFDGFMRVTGVSSESPLIPAVNEGSTVHPLEILPTQHFTQPPPRFTEASLVKELERLGIGRPSTYATIIQTIQDRRYVVQKDRRFYATLLGCIVTDKLIQAFPEIMDVKFTADMELDLDRVEEQHLDWIKLLKDFYGPFHRDVNAALEKLDHAGGTESPYKCEKCGSPMVYRISKSGFFLACTNRDKCGATQNVDEQGKPVLREVTSYKCPVCGREMIRRRGRFGEFLGCSGYSVKDENGQPLCSVIVSLDKQGNPLPPKPRPIPTTIRCEKCGSDMLLRDSKRGPFLGCSSFPKCRATKMVKKLTDQELKQVEALLPMLKDEQARNQSLIARLTGATQASSASIKGPIPTDIDCDECGKPMVIRSGRRGYFLGCSGYPKCKNTAEVPAKLLEEMGLNGNSTQAEVKPSTSEPQEEAA